MGKSLNQHFSKLLHKQPINTWKYIKVVSRHGNTKKKKTHNKIALHTRYDGYNKKAGNNKRPRVCGETGTLTY